MKKRIVASVLFLLSAICGEAQQYTFSGYTINQGLSQSVVLCILQDSDGFIWIGTQNGLNRFDGSSFQVFTFKPSDTTSISNNWIYAIAEDREGNLWIGTKGGLNRYLKNEKRFERVRYSTPFMHDVTANVYDLKCSSDGKILINTPPVLSVCDPKTMEFKHFVSNLEYDGRVKDYKIPLMEDSSGKIWIGSTMGLACFLPKEEKYVANCMDSLNFEGITDIDITALWQGANGDIWIGTPSGIHCFHKSEKKISHYLSQSPSGEGYIRAITDDGSGNIWIGTEGGGLFRLKADGQGKEEMTQFDTGNSDLFHNFVLSLTIDKSENLWIGTLSGINKTDLKTPKFNLYRKSESPYSVDLAGNVIASLFKDEKGKIWIGTWGQGLNIYDRKTGIIEHYSSNLSGRNFIPNDFVHSIYSDRSQNIWIGTRDGLLAFDRSGQQFVRPENFKQNPGLPDLTGLRIFKMIEDSHGNFWIATQNGLYFVQVGSQGPERYHVNASDEKIISSNLVYNILEDRDGLIWIATADGLDVFNPQTAKMKHIRRQEDDSLNLADNFVASLCEDYEGNIWIGTSSYVNKFSKKEGTFSYFDHEDGLPGNLIYNIVKDLNNNLWFATGNGLCRFDTISQTFKTFTIDDGLQSSEFNLGAAFVSADGELFFGGMNGFNSFYPESLKANPFVPKVVITSVYRIVGGQRDFLDPGKEGKVTLKYNEYSFNVEFAALEFTNPARNQYKYQFKGIDDTWIETGSRNFIAFSNLSPGKYTLNIKGSNNDNVWSEEPATLQIVVLPPWWRSMVAYIAYFIFIGLLIFWAFRHREKKYLKDRKILEEKVKERTQQIEAQKAEILLKNKALNELNASKDKFFSIIAHDLRNPFNYISGITDVLLWDIKNNEQTSLEKPIQNIKSTSQQAHELLENLLLWARSHTNTISFDPAPIDLKALIVECIELLGGQAVRKNITIHSESLKETIITADANMISTVIRNLLANALKFTRPGGNVWITLSRTDHDCTISIKDNGVGIEKDKIFALFSLESKHKTKGTQQETGSGLGLILCKEFVERHGGEILVNSDIGNGSEFSVVLPFSQSPEIE
jgi:ligand-binding sensor domain-containing protein/signal transduction histidine kinase